VFYFKLFENTKLADFSVSEKNKIINIAVKLARKDNPLNIKKRVLMLFLFSIVPAIIVHFIAGFDSALSVLIISTLVMNFIMAKNETPMIEPYLEDAITAFINKS